MEKHRRVSDLHHPPEAEPNVKLSHPERAFELRVVIYWRRTVEEARQVSG